MTTTGKSREQRIKDAAEVLRRYGTRTNATTTWEEIAELALEAADREPPTWPTDESVDALPDGAGPDAYGREGKRAMLRSAMLADPVVKAAIACVRGKRPVGPGTGYGAFSDVAKQILARAVNDAGL